MRPVLPLLAATAALLLSGPSTLDAVASVPASHACVKVRIKRHRQCVIAGYPCNPRYENRYERVGFRCKRNTAGQYRFWQPIKPGQSKP